MIETHETLEHALKRPQLKFFARLLFVNVFILLEVIDMFDFANILPYAFYIFCEGFIAIGLVELSVFSKLLELFSKIYIQIHEFTTNPQISD